MKKPTLRYLAFAMFIFASCSGRSTLHVEVDFLSFQRPDDVVFTFFVPATVDAAIYLLPGIQLDLTNEGPNAAQRKGAPIEVPVVAFPPEAEGIRIHLQALMAVENLDASQTASLGGVSVFVAGAEATDLYETGGLLASLPSNLIPAMGSIFAEINAVLERGSVYADILETGVARLAVRIDFPSVGSKIEVRFALEKLSVILSARPFELIP